MMVRNKENESISQNIIRVIGVLLFVKLFGLVKRSVTAAYFGTSIEMDSYLLAFDFISEAGTALFYSLSVSFLNYYILFSQRRTKEERDGFTVHVFRSFMPVALVIALFIMVFADSVSYLLAPGFTMQERTGVAVCLRMLSFTILSSCCSNIFIAILEAEKDFVPGRLSGALQSACTIFGCIFLSVRCGINSLIISYIIYCILQNLFLFFRTLKYVEYRKSADNYKNETLDILRQSFPLFISRAVVQMNAVIDKAISSALGSGNVSALSYAHFIFSSVDSIAVDGICVVALSYFSSYAAAGEEKKLNGAFKNITCFMFLLLTPIVLYMCIYPDLIVRFLYGRGNFDETSVALTTSALLAYSFGLLFIAGRDIIARLMYAHRNTKTPMINGFISVGANIVLSIILAGRFGIFGIALASSVSLAIGMSLMIWSARKILIKIFDRHLLKTAAVILLAGSAAVICSKAMLSLYAGSNGILRLAVSGSSLVLTYFGMMVLFYRGTILKIWNERKQGEGEKRI